MPALLNGMPHYYTRQRAGRVIRDGRPDIIERIKRLNPIAQYPLWGGYNGIVHDLSGNAFYGTLTDVTFDVPGIGDGRSAASFNGSTSIITLPHASMTSFDGAEGTAALFWQVSGVDIWTDGNSHFGVYLVADGNNYINIHKSVADNLIFGQHIAGGTLAQAGYFVSAPTDWLSVILSWSETDDAVIIYQNGIAKQTSGSLGAFAGALALATISEINNDWDGLLAHGALWNRALTPTEAASIGVL